MSRRTAFVLLATAALLAACATPAPQTETSPAAPAPTPDIGRPARPSPPAAKAPSFDWPAERARIANALGGSRDISINTREDGALQLLLPGADAFGRDSTDPRPTLRTTLDRIANALATPTPTDILVLGHTDSMGSELYNLQLSAQRAEAVMEYLRSRGVALARLAADGKGESEPIADNANETGRARNRRVEILIRPRQ